MPNQRKILGGEITWQNEDRPATAWYESVTMAAGRAAS